MFRDENVACVVSAGFIWFSGSRVVGNKFSSS